MIYMASAILLVAVILMIRNLSLRASRSDYFFPLLLATIGGLGIFGALTS